MKEMYRLIKSYNPNAVVDAHCSVCGPALPTMSFVDDYTNGEQLAQSGIWQTLAQPNVFRAEYMGRQFGFNADGLFFYNEPVPPEYGMALAGIHGESPRCTWGMYEPRAAGVWKLMDSFDVSTAEWMPYYDSAGSAFAYPNSVQTAFTPASPNVYASAFVHPGVNALVLVTNWSTTPCSGSISVDWSALGLPENSPVEVVNLNEMLPVVNGCIDVPVNEQELTYLWIGAGATDTAQGYIYYDDFQGNDYSSRYTSDLPPSWQYTAADSTGNICLEPAPNSSPTAFSTTSYDNGHFTNTSYTAKSRICFPNNVGPFVCLSLLDNGWCSAAREYYGYYATCYNQGGGLILILDRVNSDGATTSLYQQSWSAPYTNVQLSQWATMSATVNVSATDTNLSLEWDGVATNGMPITYTCQYDDSSAQRWSSGAGIGVEGYPGNNGGGLVIDDLAVISYMSGPLAVKTAPNNQSVSLDSLVITRSYSNSFYVESDDRSCGILVNIAHNKLPAGDRVSVVGTASTTSAGERCVNATSVTVTGAGSIAPLCMTNQSLGGSNQDYNPETGTGQQGVAGGIGPNNIGLLVKSVGVVTSEISSGFMMSDGSGPAVNVSLPSSAGTIPVGAYVTVIAPCSCMIATDGSLLPLLRVRSSSDVQQILAPGQ